LIKFNLIKEITKSEQREDFSPGNPATTSTYLTIRIGGCYSSLASAHCLPLFG